jgi:transcription elongation GreA/GreB family factor
MVRNLGNVHVFLCDTCDIEIQTSPVERGEFFYCCQGCADGGPCYCSYDMPIDMEVEMQALSRTAQDRWDRHGIPMTEQVLIRLQADFDRLVREINAEQPGLAVSESDEDGGMPYAEKIWDRQQLSRRCDVLQGVLSRARVVVPDGTAVVGSRVLVQDADGVLDTYTLVAPGEADSRSASISIDSPLGRALLGRRAGDAAAVAAPDGERAVSVIEVT